MRRTGSSTTAACSCQRGNGSNGSRSKCTRRPLCQRSGGVTPSGAPSAAPFRPIARLVVWATDCTTGPASSTTGLASVCKTPAASAAVCTPARTICTAPPVTPATRLATGLTTPGIFMRHPSITCTAPILLASYQPVHTDPRVCGPLVRRPRIDSRGSGATTLGRREPMEPTRCSLRPAWHSGSIVPRRCDRGPQINSRLPRFAGNRRLGPKAAQWSASTVRGCCGRVRHVHGICAAGHAHRQSPGGGWIPQKCDTRIAAQGCRTAIFGWKTGLTEFGG
ncbi:hypothetical protein I551_7864 [Mycobacterium ulcerans str. Harvey]|uniref:Uncharacterized protein n=1 Tax=Mycobacterium ulcerans str. Harvey TaxID=1299332 RepID=A0ABN0QM33_MYCUL|nr:hypothetical protein I551_7864 [Mycobacterium ulcerans str. Harvey]